LVTRDLVNSDQELQNIQVKAKSLVSFFKNHHIPNANLRKKIAEENKERASNNQNPFLSTEAPTRWASLHTMFKNIQKMKRYFASSVQAEIL
jgi:hypothetical protein